MAKTTKKEITKTNLTKLVLNNFVIQLCKKIKAAKVVWIRKLKKQSIKLQEKKTENEKEKKKNVSKATSCLQQIDVLKSYHLRNIAKFVLLFDKSHEEVFNVPNSSIEERALSRISHDEIIRKEMENFREKYPDWKKELPFLIKSLGILYRKVRMKRLEKNGKLQKTLDNERKMLLLLNDLFKLDIDPKMLKKDSKKKLDTPKLKPKITKQTNKSMIKKNDFDDDLNIDENNAEFAEDDEEINIHDKKEEYDSVDDVSESEKENESTEGMAVNPSKEVTSIFDSYQSEPPKSSVKTKKLKLLKNLQGDKNSPNSTDISSSSSRGNSISTSEIVKIPNLNKGTTVVQQIRLNENKSEIISFDKNSNNTLSDSDDDEPFFKKLHNQANISKSDLQNNHKEKQGNKLFQPTKRKETDDQDDSDSNELSEYDTKKYFKRKMFRDDEFGGRGRERGRVGRSRGYHRGDRGSRGRGSSRGRRGLVSFNTPRGSSRDSRDFDKEDNDDFKFVSRDFVVGQRNDFDNLNSPNFNNDSEFDRGKRGGFRGRGGRGRTDNFRDNERGRGFRGRGNSRSRGYSRGGDSHSNKSFDDKGKRDKFMGSTNYMPLGERKKPSVSTGESMLHPSWIAKKNQTNSSSLQEFQGKKITFD